ncbi:MAG: hypothetical protein IIU08_09225, partial [Clostridia bacterium]|nr:hypothetical protein [Clostridia bacterium]
IVSRETCGSSSSDRTLTVSFRLYVVILTHRRGRAHQRSCAVSEESSHWKGQTVVLVGKLFSIQVLQKCQENADRMVGLSDPRRESSDYDCGHRMKRKDSSSQALQNDKGKRRRTGVGLNEESFREKQNEITIVSRETTENGFTNH